MTTTTETSNRLYVGGLGTGSPRITEVDLQKLFEEHGLGSPSILLKTGYAFVDLNDSAAVTSAIQKLNGSNLNGISLCVQVSTGGRRRTSRISLRNLPDEPDEAGLKDLSAKYGSIQKFELVTTGPEKKFIVTYSSPEEAEECVSNLNGFEYEGQALKCAFMSTNPSGRTRAPSSRNMAPANNPRRQVLPLRMLVPVDVVGAIIGRGGDQIKEITQKSKARIDVRRQQGGPAVEEKLITITGTADNCADACQAILEVVQRESKEREQSRDVPLKMLAHNNLCGRLIGRSGTVIKRIMEETDTRITVSRYFHDAASMNMDRIITVRGAIGCIIDAERQISARLQQCFDQDMSSYPGGMPMFPPNLPNAMFGPLQAFSGGGGPPPHPGQYMRGLYGAGTGGPPSGPPGAGGPRPGRDDGMEGGGGGPMGQTGMEIANLIVPNQFVGAIIGSKGSNIRNIIRASNARIKIETLNDGEDSSTRRDRTVAIEGNPEAQWKAQYYIYDKIKNESMIAPGEPSLRVQITAPRETVGRIIGRGGKNVREIQRMTGARISLPRRGDEGDDDVNTNSSGEVKVQIEGQFFASQSAQRRVRALVNSQPLRRGPGSGGSIGSGSVGAAPASGPPSAVPPLVNGTPT